MSSSEFYKFTVASIVSFWFRNTDSITYDFPTVLIRLISEFSKPFLEIDIFNKDSTNIKLSKHSINEQIIATLPIFGETESVLCSKPINKSNYYLFENIKIQIQNRRYTDNIAFGYVSSYHKNDLLEWPTRKHWKCDIWGYNSVREGYISKRIEGKKEEIISGNIGSVNNNSDILSFSLKLGDIHNINGGRFIIGLNGKIIGNVSGVNIKHNYYFIVSVSFDVSDTIIIIFND